MERPHFGRRGGMVGMFLHAARAQELKDDQKKKLDDIAAKAKPDEDDMPKDEMKAYHTELVAGVKAGKIDKAKLDTHVAAIEKVMRARKDKEHEALNAIHAVLDPAQRKAVAAKLKANPMPGQRPGGDKDKDMAKRRLERMTKDLGLDAEQQKKIEAIIPKDDAKKDMQAEAKKKMEALYDAFEKDTFDARKIDTPDPKKMRGPMEDEAKFLIALVPILKPEQREKLAARMSEMGGRGPHGPGGPGGPHGHGHGGDKDDD
jgi:Spy/CpxP family protein refolding chaperone